MRHPNILCRRLSSYTLISGIKTRVLRIPGATNATDWDRRRCVVACALYSSVAPSNGKRRQGNCVRLFGGVRVEEEQQWHSISNCDIWRYGVCATICRTNAVQRLSEWKGAGYRGFCYCMSSGGVSGIRIVIFQCAFSIDGVLHIDFKYR